MRRINWFLVFDMIIGTLYFVIFQYDDSRLLTYLAVILVLVAPLLLKKTKYKLGDLELFCYYLFLFFADFLGCVVNLYNEISWYDLFMHGVSGIFTFGVAFFLLNRLSIQGRTFWFDVFFAICFVMFVAGIWELFEYGADCFLSMDLQHHIDTGVVDTMEDMLAALIGGVGAFFGYYFLKIERLSR